MDYFHIPEKLKIIRDVFKLKQAELASEMKMNQSQYSLLENGKQSISLDKVCLLYENLNISPEWMLYRGEPIPEDKDAITGISILNEQSMPKDGSNIKYIMPECDDDIPNKGSWSIIKMQVQTINSQQMMLSSMKQIIEGYCCNRKGSKDDFSI